MSDPRPGQPHPGQHPAQPWSGPPAWSGAPGPVPQGPPVAGPSWQEPGWQYPAGQQQGWQAQAWPGQQSWRSPLAPGTSEGPPVADRGGLLVAGAAGVGALLCLLSLPFGLSSTAFPDRDGPVTTYGLASISYSFGRFEPSDSLVLWAVVFPALGLVVMALGALRARRPAGRALSWALASSGAAVAVVYLLSRLVEQASVAADYLDWSPKAGLWPALLALPVLGAGLVLALRGAARSG